MGKKVYESKGIPKKQAVIMLVCSIILAVCGIVFIILSKARRKGVTIQSSFGSGTLGGGSVFNEEGQRILVILGILCIVFGVCFLLELIQIQKSVFRIYENHIEGIQYIPVFIVTLKKEFNLEYGQIVEIQITKGMFGSVLKIVSQGGRYGVTLKTNGEKERAYIRQKMKNSKTGRGR